MNCCVSVAVMLAVTVSLVVSDPVPHRTERRYQCAGYCKGSNKFKYVPGATYIYDYRANTVTSIRGATKENSQLHLSATASFHVVSECDFVLQLENVQLENSDLTNADIHSSFTRSAQFSAALEKNSLYFSFQDGTVDELCPGDDPVWVLNIKRGILSAFQNTMHDLSSAREKRHETDITGTCETKYDVILEEDELNKPLFVIGKMKNLLACSHRMDHFLSLQSTPYMSPSAAQSLPLIKSQQRGSQVIGDGILQKATNNEIHTFRPFSKHDSGATTMVNVMLAYKTSYSRHTPQAVGEAPKRRTTLLYEHVGATNYKVAQEDTVIKLLEELVRKTRNGIESDVPSLFSQLVVALTSMNYIELEKVFNHATDRQMRKFLLDAMPLIRTADGVSVMTYLFKSDEITSTQMDSFLTSLAFQKKPTLDMVSSVLPLLDGSPSANALLGISALVHSYCKQNKNCTEMDQVRKIIRKFEVLLGSSCQSTDWAKQQLIILALKAIGNAGVFTDSDDILRKCIQAENPIDVRLAAITAYRRFPCSENSRSHLLDLYTDKHQDTELRIAAYLAVMQCPSSHTIRRIKDTLYSEDVNQVASFVWTHLTNLQETSSHWKQGVKALVSSDFLQNKFKTDARKFSRNYEGSFFSESLSAGAAAESNVVFTPQSYLPRSATLNLTLDLFGESVNILEVGARAEGFENIVENMFGPEGYLPDNAMNKMLKKLKDKHDSDSVENSISQLAHQFNAKGNLQKEPSLSLYTRVFGNELHYTQLHGLQDMVDIVSGATSFNLINRIMQERDIDFTKSLVLIDGSYMIPTSAGFPIILALNGSATVGVKLRGYVNMKDLFTLNSIDIEGSVTPSAAIEFTGTMAVDATVTKAGIRLVSTLHTNTYIDGKVKIHGGDLVDLHLNVPREKIELLDVASQLFVLHNDQFVEIKGIEDNVENYMICSTDFMSSMIGMKSCMELTYINSSLHPTAPYFPLTGPFRFHLGITKTDTFSAYELIFRHQKKISPGESATSMIFHFDTPGSKVNRKLSAQYALDWTNSVAEASIVTPFIKVTANGKVENSDTVKSLDAVIVLNNQDLVTTRVGFRRAKNGHTGHYEPFFALSYRNHLLADISGKVSYVEGFKYSANLVIKGLSEEPVTLSGNFNMNGDKYDLMGDIRSNPLTSTFHGSLHMAKNYLSTKATVQYQFEDNQPHVLDFSAKLQDSSKGTIIKDGIYITVQLSQFPHYNVDASWEVQRSDHYFESICRLAVGNIIWQSQQLYHYQSTEDSIDFAVLCTLTCPSLGVDYGVDVQYQVTNATISSHFRMTVTPEYKLLASFNYLQKLEDEMHQHHLDVELSSPWYKTGLHGTMTESAPSQHDIWLSTWWATQTYEHRVNVSGFYLYGSNKVKTEHQLDLTVTGVLNGKLIAGITSSRNLKSQWIKLDVYNKTYLANVTYIKDIFHFIEAVVQLADSTYGGSLVLLSTAVEKGFAIDLKLWKGLTLATKVTCYGETHGLQFELFWDKDANPNKKISLVAEAVGNKREVLLETPGHYLKAEVVTVASGITGFIEWEEHHKISVQLEWNLDEGSADITAKLHTPFPRMRSLGFFGTYSLLENDGVLVVETSWQEEKLYLTTNVRRINTFSNIWGWIVDARLESTVPALAHVSFELDFRSCTDDQLTIKTFALLNYNTKQSTLEVNWKSDKSSLFGDIQLNSTIQYLEFVKFTLKYTNSLVETYGSLDINWTSKNKITVDFVMKKVHGAAGIFRIATPFVGYELTSAEYNFTKFQDSNGTTHLRMGADAVFKEYVAIFDISGSKTNSSVDGALQFKTPFTEEFKIDVLHKMENGKLSNTLLISLAEEHLLFSYLEGEVHSFPNVQLSAGVQMPYQNMYLMIKYHFLPGSLQFNCGGKWNTNNISVIAVGKYKNAEEILSVHFDMTANSSLLPHHLKLEFDHTSSQGTFQTSLHMPGDIILTNVLIVSDSLNWKNKLEFRTPSKRASIENKQSFKAGVQLEHEMIATVNGQQATGLVTFIKDSQSFIIRKAKAFLLVPWTDPVTIVYELPVGTSHIRPHLVLQFKHMKEIRIQTDLHYQLLHSSLHMEITSPFCKPIVVNASYSLAKPKLTGQIQIQWDSKKVTMESNLKFELGIMKVSGDFFIRHSDLDTDIASGSVGYNLVDPEITAHALGTYRDQKIGFGLSLLLATKGYKGFLVVQTPFQNWENLSLSGQVNMAEPTKLAVVTLSQNLEDIILSGSFSSDIYSSKFGVALTSHIPGFHSISVYGSYDVLNSNDHTVELTCDSNGKKIEIVAKLQFDNDSFSNALMAEISLKTPFKGYETLLAHYSYNMGGHEKKLDLWIVKSSWKFIIESECSFGSGEGNGRVSIQLPFEGLKELSISLSYGSQLLSVLKRTVYIVMSHNQKMVEMAGALLISDDGFLTAHIHIKSPFSGYTLIECNVSVTAPKELQKSVTLTFSKDQEVYMITGTLSLNSEASLVIMTPQKSYEARISYLNNDEDHVNSRIKKRLYGYLDMPIGRSEIDIDLDLKKMNSIISASIVSPLLMIPHIEIKGEYDLRMFPASVSFLVNKDAFKFMSMQITLEGNRLVGEIITPIDGYTNISLFGSFRIQEDKKQTNFKVKLGEHSFELLSTINTMTSEMQAEVVTTLPHIERITLHGQCDFLHIEKTAELTLTLDDSNIYGLFMSGIGDSKIGKAKVQMYTPVSGFESIFVSVKYDLAHDYYVKLLVEKNDVKNNYGDHITFTDDGTIIRIETPYKDAEDSLLYGRYHTGNDERSANLTVARNGHLTIFDTSFKFENKVAVINFSTPFEILHELIFTLDFSEFSVDGKESALSVSVLRNSQHLLRASSHILIDWDKEISAQFELNTPLLPSSCEHLSFNLYFTPVFPPAKIQALVLKNGVTILDLRSNFDAKLYGFTYDLELAVLISGHEKQLLSIDFSPEEKFAKLNIDLITSGTLKQYIGDLRINKATGALSAIFISPIMGYEKFSFQWKQGYDFIDIGFITPFKGYENHTLATHFEDKHGKKSARFFISRNDDIIGFRAGLEHTDSNDILKLHVVTPFMVFKKLEIQTQYVKFQTKMAVGLSVTANNQQFEVDGELLIKENFLEAKLDISSSLQTLEKMNVNFFYDLTSALTVGGNLDIGDISANISGTIDFDFLQGELLGSLTGCGRIIERRIMWSLENAIFMKTAKIAVNLGYELNFVIDAILNISSLKNVKAQLSYIKPMYLYQLYPYTSTYKLQWNVRNMSFDGGLFLMLHNVPFCNLNLNVDLDKATGVNILRIDYFGFFYNYKIHLAYQLMKNRSIELSSTINLHGTEIISLLNFTPKKSKFTTQCDEFHFSLNYDLATEHKVLNVEYQVNHNTYGLSFNLTLHKSNFPVASIALKTPIKHYTFLHVSNQYSMNMTHKEFKILLQKEEKSGEISLSLWKSEKNVGLKGNFSLPIKYLSSWYGVANLDMTSGLEGSVDCLGDSTKKLALNIRYAPDSLKANTSTHFMGKESINAELLLNRAELVMALFFSVNWGEKKLLFNGTASFNNGSKPEIVIFFVSPWTDPFALLGKYDNKETPVVTMILEMGSEVIRLEGQIKYSIKDSKFDMDFVSELNGHKMTAKAGYDFENSTKETYFEARFAALSLLVSGVSSPEGLEGRLHVKTPFNYFKEIAADGMLTVGQSATFKLRWNDKFYTLHGAYEHKHGQLGCQFTLLSPSIKVEGVRVDIKYNCESAYLKLGSPSEALYLDFSYNFQTYLYFVGATLKVPSIVFFKNLSFTASFDADNLTASAIGQWSTNKMVNISAKLLPSDHFIKMETPFAGFEKIIASGSFKNEHTQLAFIGKLEVGNDENSIHVQHIVGNGFMQHSLNIFIPTFDKINFKLTLQFDDPRNMSAKLIFGGTSTESIFSADGMLNLKDMFANLSVHHPFLEGGLTCKTWLDVAANLNIKTISSLFTMEGSYTLSRNAIVVKWNAQTPGLQSTTVLGGSYEYDDKSELKTILYFNDDRIAVCYKINHTSLVGSFELNSSTLPKIKDFSLNIQISHSPSLHGSVSYKYNTSSGGVGVFLSKTEETVIARGIVSVQPLLGPVNHTVQIAFNMKDPQKFLDFKYESKEIWVSCENDDNVFKVTVDVNSKVLGTQKILMVLEKNWEKAHIEIMNVFVAALKAKHSEGSLVVRASGMEHEALYHLTTENGFHGSLVLVSPLISNGKVNVTADANYGIEDMFIDLKFITGTESYHATLKLNNTEKMKTVKAEVTAVLKTVLSLNASVVVNKYGVQAETSINFLETVSNAVLRHKWVLPLDTELIIMSPFLPKNTFRFILNTENNSVMLYGSHGDMSYGEYIMLQGAMNHNKCMAYLNFKAPKLPLVQYINISGIFRLGGKGKYDLGLSTQFLSAMLMTELSADFHLSPAGIDTVIKFSTPWKNGESYEAVVLIPFMLSNSMRPHISLNLGKNSTYSLHGTFVSLEDIQQIGFGAQYKFRKLGGVFRIENTPIPSLQVEIDIPLGDNIGHYGVNMKVQKGSNLFGLKNALNYTHIVVEWDSNQIELRYTLSYNGTNAVSPLDTGKNVQCTLVLELITPFYGYEQNGLKMYVGLSPSNYLIITSLNYPGNSKPFEFELNYQLKGYNDVSFVSQLHIPFISALEDVALVLSNKFEEKCGRFRSVLGGHWNKEELTITFEGNLKEETVLKGIVKLKLIGHAYTLETNYENSKRDIWGPFVIRAQLNSSLSVLKNAKIFVEIDIMKSVLASITHNSKELLGFHIYSDEAKLFGVKVRNPWRSVYFVCSYDIRRDIMIQAELSWDTNPLNRSQFGVNFAVMYGPDERQHMSVTLILPSRVLMLNLTRQVTPVHIEHGGSFSWKKDQIVGFRTVLNINSSSDVVAVSTVSRIDLPHRSFELGSYANAGLDDDTVKYTNIGTEFMWDALEDRNKKISIALRHCSPVLEIVLQHAAMKNDLVVHIEKHGELSYSHLPFTMKIEIRYSPLPEEFITMEAHVQYPTNADVGLNVGFSLHHIPTFINFRIGAEVAQISKENSGRLSAEYLNSYTGQKHWVEFMGRMNLLHPEIKVAVRTLENQLEVHAILQSGSNGHYSALVDLLMNQKEPLSVEASIQLAEPRAELKVCYGNSHSYKMYAGVPHYCEVTFGIEHVLYQAEYEDVAFMLRLNTSTQLWSRIKWQPRALTELKTGFLQEYADIIHVVQSIGSDISEVWLKDFAHKCNTIYPVLVDVVDHIVSSSMIEIGEIYKDFLDIGEEIRDMYRRNDFYLQDLQPYISKLMSYVTERASGICQLLLDGLESIYLAVQNFIVMFVDTFQIDISQVFNILGDIKVVAGKTVMCIVNFIDEVKRLHLTSKEYLKTKIEATRIELIHAEENMKTLLVYIENCMADLFTSYIQLLEPYLRRIENTMELLNHRVIDFEDKISEYILDMVDTVLGAEEVQELMTMYNKYSSWLEELHLQDYITQVTKLFRSISKLIMQDIRRVFADYMEYVNYLIDAMNNMYEYFNAMPLIAYTKHVMNTVSEKVEWVWQHYELSDYLKAQMHSWFENLDKILLRLLSAIDMDTRSPTKSLIPSITLHPDIGLIEYSQKLPIEWNGFNELPKFEQLQLYEQAKEHANEIASLDKYRYYLMDTFYDITSNISVVSVLPPFSAYGMVIGKHNYITFDKKFYNFKAAGECSYLLAHDFLNNKFSAFVTYKIENRDVKKLLTILTEGHHIEISSNKRVKIDGQKVELPVAVDSHTWIKHTGERIVVQSELGMEVECNLYYDICTIELSGWYFGKTGGMLGTFDYEPSNDLSLPNGTAAHSVEAFANSWHVGSVQCHSVNHATVPTYPSTSKESQASDSNQCTAYFEDQLSPLHRCFSQVEPEPFYQMCLSELASDTGVCRSVAAYVSQCRRASVDIWMPHKCVHCSTSHGSTMNVGQLEVYDGVEAMLADVVFVVEQLPCIKNINLAELMSKLDIAMSLQGLNAHFSVVGFNGETLSEPQVHTSSGEIWATVKGAEKALRSLQTATSKSFSSGNKSTFSALWHASHLPFRATASKTIVLLQCISCQEKEDEYNNMISMLLENDITLHMLQPHALKMHSGQGKASKVYGVDLNGAFNGHNLRSLRPSFPLLRQVALPKDMCTPLAFETNGTLFNMDHLIQNNKGTHRFNVKKFIDVWARRVALTAKPSQCQKCQCVANEDGVGQIMCSKCLSPSVEHFLKEWENPNIDPRRTRTMLVDDVDYPA